MRRTALARSSEMACALFTAAHLLLVGGCSDHAASSTHGAGHTDSTSSSAAVRSSSSAASALPQAAPRSSSEAPRSTPGAVPQTDAEFQACTAEIERVKALDALAGTPALDAQRGAILGRAKGEAIVFTRPPKLDEPSDVRIKNLRDLLKQSAPILGIPKVLAAVRYFPEQARQIFLPEGYVYAERADEATVLSDVLRLGRLFNEATIYLARGAEVFQLEHDAKLGIYRFVDGPEKGEEAFLLFGDRVAAQREKLFPLLHRDLAALIDEEAPTRLTITRHVNGWALAEIQHGEDRAPAVLRDDGTSLHFACAAVPTNLRARYAATRDLDRRRHHAMAPVREAIRVMIREKLRFDEPLKEVGQQDGSLRPLWRWSYDHGGTGFGFNGVGYAVFDSSGRPYPPQVCIDFVLDSFERGSGTWFGGRDDTRGRSAGGIDFDTLEPFNRRSAAEFAKFADAHPDIFTTWNLADDERIQFYRRSAFFSFLSDHASRFHEGDVIVIHGLKSDGNVHYHAFMIDGIDPISGVPHRLAGNAGRPRLQTFEGIMRGAPARSIKHVVSPRTEWLERVMLRHDRGSPNVEASESTAQH